MKLEGSMVKIRYKKYFSEQKQWVLFGKVLEMSENWIMINGKGVIQHHETGYEIDAQARVLLVPRDNIAHIRILPENFNTRKITIVTRAGRDFAKVTDGPDTSIGEEL